MSISDHVYNEIEPAAVTWLEELTIRKEIPLGRIDDRSIQLLRGADLEHAVQFHTFAGIGGWPLALRKVGWPEDLEVWTGSCPCQPFSVAGNLKKEGDHRHLWPDWLKLIAERVAAGKPVPVIFGEQVASEAGKRWFADVRADLEALGYEVGGADLCAAGAGAKHIRQRIYFVAYARMPEPRWRERLVQAAQALAGSRRDLGGGKTCSSWRVEAEPRPPAVADGVQGRVAFIKGYGNAIYPDLAAEFIAAFMEVVAAGGWAV